jgi:hypothetical protein
LGVIWGIQEQSKFSVALDNSQWQIQLQLPSVHENQPVQAFIRM